MTRAAQMATQYYWLYERTGPLTWRERAPGEEIPVRNRTNHPVTRAAKTGQNDAYPSIAAGATIGQRSAT